MMNKALSSVYYDPKNPASFSTAQKLHKEVRVKEPTLTLSQTREWLRGQNAYTLHKAARRRFKRNRIVVSEPGDQYQADLVDLQSLSRHNGGHKYILTAMDLFSKKAFAQPLKSKQAKDVKLALVTIFDGEPPEKLQTDQGREFNNAYIKRWLKDMGVQYFTTKNYDIKCSIVERFNRTLKAKMFKYFTASGTQRYVDVLQDLVNSYNNTTHTTTKFKPNQVNATNTQQVFQNMYGVPSKREYIKMSKSKPKLRVGDLVRQKYDLGPLDKGYHPNWTDQAFTIQKAINQPRALYTVKEENGQVVDRRFYPEEVQKITASSYRVEKVLRTKTENGIKYCLVKWLNHPNSYNSWEPESVVKDLRPQGLPRLGRPPKQ
jgi:transposase InsO family protein